MAGEESISVVKTFYEDDNADDFDISEQSPLIATDNPRDGRSARRQSLHRTRDISEHSLHPLDHKPAPAHTHHKNEHVRQPLAVTWMEWSTKNGLHPKTWTKHTYLRTVLLATLLTLVVLAFTVFRVQDRIKDILHYIEGHKSTGAVLFVTFYTIACWLFLPGSLFTIGAGFLFKPLPLALAIVLLGDVFGAIGTFLFGRFLFYDWVKGMMSKHPKFNALDEVIREDGWKIVVMLRLTPIPFNLITYFFSVTSISLFTLVWATAAGVFPGSCLGIWIGSLLNGLSGIDNPELETKNIVILIMNGVLIACCITTLSIFGKRSLRKAMGKLDQHHHEQQSLLASEESNEDQNLLDLDLEAAVESAVANTELDAMVDSEEGVSSAADSTVIEPPVPTGFTRGEKWTFLAIVVVVLIDVSVCIPLYYHYANQQ
ncbi:snare associated Golgi protein-domain-containing protein [Mortierella sp. GBAus27b]|nr:snare associated Golgi protein-domain-containing protein [Mortierella sp. GBAus27b]